MEKQVSYRILKSYGSFVEILWETPNITLQFSLYEFSVEVNFVVWQAKATKVVINSLRNEYDIFEFFKCMHLT